MLTLSVCDGDLLEFQTGQDAPRRVRCQEFDKGELLLLQPAAEGSPFYKPLALLAHEAWRTLWPGVALRYFQNHRGLWKVAFDLPAEIKVLRNPATPKAA